MSDKSARKRSYIIEKARDVFAAKGFLTVTMKDIVEACEISRGGLYLYFDDTEKLFREVLRLERLSGGDEEIEQADTAVDMLSAFLREQKKEILACGQSLIVAVYEYYFYLERKKNQPQDESGQELPPEHEEKDRFEMSAKVLGQLIEKGIEEGYLDCEEPQLEAYNIMFALEGLKICSVTIGVTEEQVTKEINYLFSHLFIRDDDQLLPEEAALELEPFDDYDEEDQEERKDSVSSSSGIGDLDILDSSLEEMLVAETLARMAESEKEGH